MNIILLKNSEIEIPIESIYVDRFQIYSKNNIVNCQFPDCLYFLLVHDLYNGVPVRFCDFLSTVYTYDKNNFYVRILSYFESVNPTEISIGDIFFSLDFLYAKTDFVNVCIVFCFLSDCVVLKYLNSKNILKKIEMISKLMSIYSFYLLDSNKSYNFINSSKHCLYYEKDNNYYLMTTVDCIYYKININLNNSKPNFVNIHNEDHLLYYIEGNAVKIIYFTQTNETTLITKEVLTLLNERNYLINDKIIEVIAKDEQVLYLNIHNLEKKLLKQYQLLVSEVFDGPIFSAGDFLKFSNSYYSVSRKMSEFTNLNLVLSAGNYCLLHVPGKNIYYLVSDKFRYKFKVGRSISEYMFEKQKIKILNLIICSI